jgi:hypothetical protein
MVSKKGRENEGMPAGNPFDPSGDSAVRRLETLVEQCLVAQPKQGDHPLQCLPAFQQPVTRAYLSEEARKDLFHCCERSPKTTARDRRKRQHVGWLSVCLAVAFPVKFQLVGLAG